MGIFRKALVFGISGSAAALAATEIFNNPVQTAHASAGAIHAPAQPWPHSPVFTFNGHDLSAVRRGFQVYRQVCAACHSLNQITFRSFVGVTHTEDEMKEIAKEYDIVDADPDDDGNPIVRPGKLTDFFPSPYKNEQEARKANNGANPPDMSWLRNAKTNSTDFKDGEDYIYSLLTGYCDPPAGVTLGENQNFNPYFDGGAIGMAPPLYNEIIQYEDGTPATLSQLAADVSQFLHYVSLPEHNEARLMALKFSFVLLPLIPLSWWGKRHIFAGVKTAKTTFRKLK